MYITKRYDKQGQITVIARKPRITQALCQHIMAVREAEDPELVITTGPKGLIYGYGDDVRRFRKNKRCNFKLRYGFTWGEDDV